MSERQVTDLGVELCNRAMVRLLTANDWFGDGQIREVILDEFNSSKRQIINGRIFVVDKPFNTLLERVTDNEPMALAIRYELKYIKETLNANLKPIGHNREGRT